MSHFFADACPALLVAVCDALRLEPCRRRFSCLRQSCPRGNVREFIGQCWAFVPESVREKTFERLQVYRFACEQGYVPQSPLPELLHNFRPGGPLGQALDEQYEDWESSHRLQRPEKSILRIIYGSVPLTLETAAYIMKLIGLPAKQQIAEILLRELLRVCHHVTFVERDLREQLLVIQFLPGGNLEQRPLEPNCAM